MKRLHVSVSVDDLDRSIAFYATLFGTAPGVRKDDYAKWMLDDPRVNFSIAARGRPAGVDHLGIQAESAAELSEIAGRLQAAGEAVLEQHQTVCCYARSDKAWATDPSGVAWESFLTHGEATIYGEDTDVAAGDGTAAGCCGPDAAATPPANSTRSACCRPEIG